MEELDAAARASSAEADALHTETAELRSRLELVYGIHVLEADGPPAGRSAVIHRR